ncbi:TonB-dependent receptor [Pseudomonas sp. SL4(2022)]|uniref:TonB-dependent receptor plug domain-containing protein n=1 Tax=Pseudomonas sp. SL4(2022) TaxID=2994661 RepID=UPI0022718D7E|nr:TonB-dependent receptor [Pseudomonas sp. SL4(2022)]WAC46204.1 TonB-dependent receptor [Pseudomonas sp. SL4(2022)]
MYRISTLALAVVACAGASALHAQSLQLQDMVVTATGTPQPIKDVQASVQVIDRHELNQHSAHSVTEVLKSATGVQANNAGATGALSIRGFNSNQSLILINGQRRTNNYSSNNPNQISTFDIERIEIVRGPMSSLYGSDALGGVINIITRQPGEDPGVSAQVTTGAAREGRETLQSGINARFGDGTLGHSLTLEQEHRNALRHEDSTEDDSGRLINLSAAYRGRWTPDDVQSLGWAVEIFDRDNDRAAQALIRRPGGGPPVFDTLDYSNFEDERRTFYGLDYQRLIGPGELKLRSSAGRSSGATNRSFPETLRETTRYKQYQSDALYSLPVLDTHKVTLGGGYNRDELDVTINAQSAARDNAFALLQDEWQINDQWTLVAGARYDHFDDFDSALTPKVSLGWRDGDWRARLGYGEGFRAPSLLEQYASFTRGGGTSVINGNPNLQPEQSQSWELAVGRTLGALDLEAVLHQSDIDDLIMSRVVRSQPIGGGRFRNFSEYMNVDKARIRGLELNADWQASENLRLRAGYEWLDAMDANTDQRLEGRARRTYRLESTYTLDYWSLTARARHVGDYLSRESGCRVSCEAYDTRQTLVDLNISHALTEQLELFAGVDNLFDQRDPDNYVNNNAGTGGGRNDPDTRYFYVGSRIDF